MAGLVNERVCAEVEGEIVVFLIGMRINRFWKIWKWLPVALAMPRMLRELSIRPELGLLSARTLIGLRNLAVLQYWQSAEHLRLYGPRSGQGTSAGLAGVQRERRDQRRRGHLARNLCGAARTV